MLNIGTSMLLGLLLASAILGMVAAAVAAACTRYGGLATTIEYDLLILEMMWPFSSCVFLDKLAGGACQSPPASFLVRGLWPVRFSGEQSVCCALKSDSDSEFQASAILDLAPQLRHLFPDLSLRGSDTALWEAQWDTYGRCLGLSERLYFRRILELSRRFDFMRALSAQGIVASDHRTHKLSTVQKAANAAVGGFHVRIRCRQLWRGPILDAVHVCLDPDTFHVVDCSMECAERDIACCPKGVRLTMPFWGRENGVSGSRRNSSGSVVDGKGDGIGVNVGEGPGYWIGQVAVAIVLAGGVIFWAFSALGMRRDSEYLRI
jgi:ribonuclease I